MHIEDDEQSNVRSIPGLLVGYSAYLKPFIMTRQNGDQTNLDAVWKRGKDSKDFDLGPLSPGEAVALKLGYERSNRASYSSDTGLISGDVIVSFRLQ
jgi:hypothetical protein